MEGVAIKQHTFTTKENLFVENFKPIGLNIVAPFVQLIVCSLINGNFCLRKKKTMIVSLNGLFLTEYHALSEANLLAAVS